MWWGREWWVGGNLLLNRDAFARFNRLATARNLSIKNPEGARVGRGRSKFHNLSSFARKRTAALLDGPRNFVTL